MFLVVLSGGEPFVHPAIDDILAHAHLKFRHVQVLSNGTAISRNNLRTIQQIVDEKGYFPIQISIDAVDDAINRETRGDAQPVLETIRQLNEVGASVTAAIVVTARNVDAVPDTVRQLSSLTQSFHVMQFKRQELNPYKGALDVPHDRMLQLWNALEQVKTEQGLAMKLPLFESCEEYTADGAPCMAGFSHLVIDPDLRVRACDRCTDEYVGDLNTQTLMEVWSGPEIAEWCAMEMPRCHN